MLSETKFPILDKCAYQAARRYNNNPSDIEDCYDYILEHVVLKISDSDNAAFIRMKCQSAAHNWHDSEARHTSRINHALETDDLAHPEYKTPEEQVIEREDLRLIGDLFKYVNLTELEKQVLEIRMGGFITLADIAQVENISHASARDASARARAKITPVITELAAEYEYDTTRQANTRKGHCTPSGWRADDQYHPRRKENQHV